MKKTETHQINPIVRRFIEDAGNTTQSFGVGRVLGQIFAFLYFSEKPRNLADMQKVLGISKGSASTGVRQLEQWGAVRKVWIKGDRKDYYRASDWFGKILKSAVLDTVGKKMTSYNSLLEDVEHHIVSIEGKDSSNGNGKFIKDRIDHLRKFQKRAQTIWGSKLLQKLLK